MPSKGNRAERVYAFLREHEGVWIEAVRFEPIGGRQAWRTAISEARELAERDGYVIDNRQRRVTQHILCAVQFSEACNCIPEHWTLSEYGLFKRQRPQPSTDAPYNANTWTLRGGRLGV